MNRFGAVCIGPVAAPAAIYRWFPLESGVGEEIAEWIGETKARYPQWDEWSVVDTEGPLARAISGEVITDPSDVDSLLDNCQHMDEVELAAVAQLIEDGADLWNAAEAYHDRFLFRGEIGRETDALADWHADVYGDPRTDNPATRYIDWDAYWRDIRIECDVIEHRGDFVVLTPA